MSGALTKGALVEYLPTWPPTPVVTVFQYNPESMTHTWTQPQPPGKPGVEANNPLAVAGMPGETFQFTIFLDSDDDIVSQVPRLQQAAQQSGVGARLAALEMLLYPVGSTQASGGSGGLVGTASAGSSASPTWSLPNSTLPVVLFFWNSNRVVPVRVTTLTVTETLYDTNLNPTHAQAQLSLRVLTPTELAATNPAPGTPADLAVTAYKQTLATRSQWASGSTASPPESITSKLPH
ncbi:MAG TPA: hypothetical protein VKG80_00075 [Trebonia sp.]|nr:hypothetical protein [Trebonia sp.]